MLAVRTGLTGFHAAVGGGGDVAAAMLWGLAVIVVIVLGGLVVLWLRRRLLSRDLPDDGGFATLETLRKQGLVTEDELRAIRRKVVDRQEDRVETLLRKTDPAGTGKSDLTPGDELSDSKTKAEGDTPPKEPV